VSNAFKVLNYDYKYFNVRDLIWHDDQFWIATYEGLFVINPASGEVVRHLSSTDGLQSNRVYSITAHNGKVILGTESGISIYNKVSDTFFNIYEEDGMANAEFNSRSTLVSSDGVIWMGGINGLTWFRLDDMIHHTELTPSLFLKQIQTIYESGTISHSISKIPEDYNYHFTLKPDEFLLNVYLVSPDYNHTKKGMFYWYAEGLETPWNNATQVSKISIPKFNPGNYRVHFRAVDSRGRKSSNDIVLNLTVKQFWYLTKTAFLFYLIVIMGIAGTIVYYLVQRKYALRELTHFKSFEKVKSAFYTNITHELRTPLTIILGYAEKGKEKSIATNHTFSVYFAAIEKNCGQLLNLINQVLEISMMDAGIVRVYQTAGNLGTFLDEILSNFREAARNKSITLKYKIETSSQEYFAFDHSKLKMVITNLVSNAIKFTPEYGFIYISAAVNSDQSQNEFSLNFEISDSGPGVSPEKLDKVFERYYSDQVENLRIPKGYGIGLAVAKDLIELLNGQIGAQNLEPRGCMFYFSIPLKAAEDASMNIPMQPIKKMTHYIEAPIYGSNFKRNTNYKLFNKKDLPWILVIDDHKEVREFIIYMLEEKYNILQASNGQAGLELAKTYIPDIIISDVMMPEMNGFELCLLLKSDILTNHIPIIMLTAKSDVKSTLTGLSYGADAYVSKPFYKKELLLRIENMLNLTHAIKEKFSFSASMTDQTNQDNNAQDEFYNKYIEIIEQLHNDSNISIEDIAEKMGLSRSQLFRKLKAITGMSHVEIIKKFRLEKAKWLLTNTRLNVSDISYQVGFSSPKYFSNVFYKEFDLRPSEWRRQFNNL